MADNETGQVPSDKRSSTTGRVLAWVGGLLAVGAVASAFIPLYDNGRYSLVDGSSLCGSALGALAQGLSQQAANACNQINGIVAVTWIVGIAGVIVLAVGVVKLATNR